MTPLPCSATPDRFVTPYPSEALVDELAAAFCDTCPVRAACYASAIRDESTWGVYGGVFFACGRPVPSRQVTHFARRVDLAGAAARIDEVLAERVAA